MKALLVYPAIPDTFWSFKHILKFIRKRAAHVPLGLLTIASMLPEDWQLRLLDMNAQELTDQDIAWADTVLIGAMVIQRESVKEVALRSKAAGKLVIAGGPLFSSMWNEFDEIDHFVLNEAEVT